MLHLRLRVPDDLMDQVTHLLTDDDTVTGVTVLRDACVKPPGSLVLADVARENASGVVGALRDLDLHNHGSITMDEPDVILSRDAEEAERIAPGSPDDGVVWVAVENRLRNDARLSWSFVAFLTLASLIAGVGRLLDQPILIVGSMVVGPEFAPLAAICFALARPRLSLILPAVRTFGVGFVVAVGISAITWFTAYHAGWITRKEATSGPLTDFIVKPDLWSLVIAVLAGVAGVLSLTSAKSGPLVGVFISVTTVPAIGAFALTLATHSYGDAWHALLQLAINVLGILLAGTLTLWVQRQVWSRLANRRDNEAGARGHDTD